MTGNQTAQVVAGNQPEVTPPTERVSMRRIRDVLRLTHAQGFRERAIALSLGLEPTAARWATARTNGAFHTAHRPELPAESTRTAAARHTTLDWSAQA